MKKQIEGQMTIFEFIVDASATKKTKEFDPLREFAKRGSLVVGGKIRIRNKFSETSDKKERVAFLKKEYGIGGYGGPRTDIDTYQLHHADWGFPMTKNKILLTWFVPKEDEEYKEFYSYEQLHDMIQELILEGAY